MSRQIKWGLHNRVAALLALSVLATLSACGGEDGPTDRSRFDSGSDTGQKSNLDSTARDSEAVAPARCPDGVPGCRVAEGRIVYVERVDPDGDGDAHFVIADPRGITLPGLTAIDVRRGLRPRPLPGRGELISAAGPVQTGSYGQSQIHALELHVAGR